MFTSIVKDGELYVFKDGELVYKRWFQQSGDIDKKDRSIVLNNYGSPTELPKQGEM